MKLFGSQMMNTVKENLNETFVFNPIQCLIGAAAAARRCSIHVLIVAKVVHG